MKKRICAAVIICVITLPYVWPIFSSWSRINSTEHEIDIETGRNRVSSYFYWVRTNTEYRETSISSEIYDGSLNSKAGTWVKVSSFGPYVNHSPHYNYHSATHQMGQLKLVWHNLDSDKASRITNAKDILSLWKEHGDDSAADSYIAELYEGQ